MPPSGSFRSSKVFVRPSPSHAWSSLLVNISRSSVDRSCSSSLLTFASCSSFMPFHMTAEPWYSNRFKRMKNVHYRVYRGSELRNTKNSVEKLVDREDFGVRPVWLVADEYGYDES